MKVSYQWLQNYFKADLPDPAKIETVLGLQAFEPEGMEHVGDDTVFDFDVLPNRAHDCLCHYGIAGEISVLFDIPLERRINYFWAQGEPDVVPATLSIKISDEEKCRRYIGRKVLGVQVRESPDWLKKFLITIGQKPINNIVDATNFVMFDLGQPLHAFDGDKVVGGITVRTAKQGETITTLSGEVVALVETDLVIADDMGPLAIAGVKGGKRAEVTEATKNIILEAANFHPVSTRKTARRISLLTDSSKRFENEISAEISSEAIDAVTKLITDPEMAGTPKTIIEEIVDVYVKPPEQKTVSVMLDRANALLGTDLSGSDVADIFRRFSFSFTEDNGEFIVSIPHQRMDLDISEDLIEEIGRVYGYHNIKTVLPKPRQISIHKELYFIAKIRTFLTQLGFSEVYTYTFTDHGTIEMENAVASDKRFLRTDLHGNLRESLEQNVHNAELLGRDNVLLFEIGTVYPKAQELHLALASGSAKKKDSFDLSLVIQKLERHVGAHLEVHNHAGILEINLTNALGSLPVPLSYNEIPLEHKADHRSFHPISPYPFVLRDIAVWIPAGTDKGKLEAVISENSEGLLAREPRLVDEYAKDDRVSYAYRLVFQSHEKTLSDSEVNEIMAKITALCTQKGWEVR